MAQNLRTDKLNTEKRNILPLVATDRQVAKLEDAMKEFLREVGVLRKSTKRHRAGIKRLRESTRRNLAEIEAVLSRVKATV